MRNGRPTDKELFDRLALAVQALKEADLEYKQARFQYGERRVEHLAAGREPEDFGVVLEGMDAQSQFRREQIAREHRAIDEDTARSFTNFTLRT